jgi:hypothetical protein
MSSTKEMFARHYDRVAAVVVLALLLFSLLYLVLEGMDIQKSLDQDKASFDPPKAEAKTWAKGKREEVKKATLKIQETQHAISEIKVKSLEKNEDEKGFILRDLFTPDAHYACEFCNLPIRVDSQKCAAKNCGKDQKPLDETEIASRDAAVITTPVVKPEEVDTDKDGLPDMWEEQYGLNPKDEKDVDGDLDKDGISNHDEYLAKTNPADAASHPDYEKYISVVNFEERVLRMRAIKTSPGGLGYDTEGKTINLTAVDFVELNEDGAPTRTFVRQLPGSRIGKTVYRYQAYNEKPTTMLEYTTSVQGAASKQKAKMAVNPSTITVTIMSENAIATYEAYVKIKAEREAKEKEALVRPEVGEEVKKLREEEEKLKKKDAQFAKKERETKGRAYDLTFYQETYYKNEGTTWIGEPIIGLTADLNVELPLETLEIKALEKGKTFKVKREEYTVGTLDKNKETVLVKRKKDGKTFKLSKK